MQKKQTKTKNLVTQEMCVEVRLCHGRNAFPLLVVPNEAELQGGWALWVSGTEGPGESQESGDAALQVPELAGFNAEVKKNPS